MSMDSVVKSHMTTGYVARGVAGADERSSLISTGRSMVSTMQGAGKGCLRSVPSQCRPDRLGSMRRVTNEGVPGSAPRRVGAVPPPLRVAAALAGIEALLLLGYGLTLLPAMDRDRVAMGATTVVFFLLYGAALAWSAWQLSRRQSWARSFVVFAQLIQLGVAWSFRGGDTTAVAVVMAVIAFVVIAGVFHPQSLQALED